MVHKLQMSVIELGWHIYEIEGSIAEVELSKRLEISCRVVCAQNVVNCTIGDAGSTDLQTP